MNAMNYQQAMKQMKRDRMVESFAAYCRANPSQRFWQALRNWSGHNFILVSQKNEGDTQDTFHWRGKLSASEE